MSLAAGVDRMACRCLGANWQQTHMCMVGMHEWARSPSTIMHDIKAGQHKLLQHTQTINRKGAGSGRTSNLDSGTPRAPLLSRVFFAVSPAERPTLCTHSCSSSVASCLHPYLRRRIGRACCQESAVSYSASAAAVAAAFLAVSET
jgi:hypothetical protein